MTHKLIPVSILTAWMAVTALAADAVFDARDFGAKPDGVTLCTAAIQKAMDACASAGGGTVVLAGGKFLSGTIYLRSHVMLRVEAGTMLLGSKNIADYPRNIPAIRSYTDKYVEQSLIAGENLEFTGITGRGTIDGQGESFMHPGRKPTDIDRDRPYLIRLVNCRDVLVENVRLQHSAMWMEHYLGCERVTIRGIHVWNFGNANNDGLDLDGCKDCTVSQCVFESDDDGITFKSTFERPCESITVSDCIARSHCNAIKMGTESNGGFRNITIANCVVTSPTNTNAFYGRGRGMSGISLETVDGGKLEHVAISNIAIHGVIVPLFLRLGDRARPFKEGMAPQPIGTLHDVVINNIVATGVGKTGCAIAGLPDHAIENVSLNNIVLTFEGGGARKLADKAVAEYPKRYPESSMFGDLPAYGFYCRHVKGLRFSNIRLKTTDADLRHALVFDDVENLAVDGLDAAFWPGGAAVLGMAQVRDAFIHGCQPRAKDGTFLKLAGDKSRNITLTANDLAGVAQTADVAPDAPKDALAVK
jgi:polygalacturonase